MSELFTFLIRVLPGPFHDATSTTRAHEPVGG
jgi:hypothetical protein